MGQLVETDQSDLGALVHRGVELQIRKLDRRRGASGIHGRQGPSKSAKQWFNQFAVGCCKAIGSRCAQRERYERERSLFSGFFRISTLLREGFSCKRSSGKLGVAAPHTARDFPRLWGSQFRRLIASRIRLASKFPDDGISFTAGKSASELGTMDI